MMGSSRDLAVGTVAVGSLLMASMLGSVVNHNHNPNLFLHLAFTATFFAGIFQAALGLFRYFTSLLFIYIEPCMHSLHNELGNKANSNTEIIMSYYSQLFK